MDIDHTEICYYCGKVGGNAPEPGFMLLLRFVNDDTSAPPEILHAHVFCEAALVFKMVDMEKAKEVYSRKATIIGVCAGTVDSPCFEENLKKGRCFVDAIFDEGINAANVFADIGMCEAELENSVTTAARRVTNALSKH